MFAEPHFATLHFSWLKAIVLSNPFGRQAAAVQSGICALGPAVVTLTLITH
jgi:hypothetical protein